MTKKLPLQNGMYALVDDEDYEKCSKFNWYIHSYRNKGVSTTFQNKTLHLDIFVKGNKDSKQSYFHKNHNNLDFRKENLVLSKNEQKHYVGKASKNNNSGYKGVCWDKSKKKWMSQIMVNRKNIYLGRFNDKKDAANAYNNAAIKYFGELAYLNKIGEDNKEFELLRGEKENRTRKRKNNKYRGVVAHKKGHIARIGGKERMYLGFYYDKTEAAKAYDRKAYELYGDEAILNFPELIEEYKGAIK